MKRLSLAVIFAVVVAIAGSIGSITSMPALSYAAEPVKQKAATPSSAPTLTPAPAAPTPVPAFKPGSPTSTPINIPDQPDIRGFEVLVSSLRLTTALPGSQLTFRWAVRPGVHNSPIQSIRLTSGSRSIGTYLTPIGEVDYVLPSDTPYGTVNFVLHATNQIGREATKTLSITVPDPGTLSLILRPSLERAVISVTPYQIQKRAGFEFDINIMVNNNNTSNLSIPNGLAIEAWTRTSAPNALACQPLENQAMARWNNNYTIHCSLSNPGALVLTNTASGPTWRLNVNFKYRGTALFTKSINLVERSFFEVAP